MLRLHRGVQLALGAAFLFGASTPFAKVLLRDVSPQLLAGLLYLGSGFGLLAVWTFRRSRHAQEGSFSRREWAWLSAAIVSGGCLAPLLLMIGLTRTDAAAASLLLNLVGVFTALLAWFVFRENFDRRIALGMLAIVAGGIVLSWQGAFATGNMYGPVAVVAACACWGLDNNLTQKVSSGDPFQVAMLKGLIAGAVNTTLALVLGSMLPDLSSVTGALLLGFVSYGVSLVLFVLALRYLGTARTGAYFSTAPFIGAVVSLLIFHARPTLSLMIASCLMGFGVWLHITERHEHLHVHEPMEHEHMHVHDAHHQHEHTLDDPPGEPHSHAHRHEQVEHSHPHYPDIHHRHSHD